MQHLLTDFFFCSLYRSVICGLIFSFDYQCFTKLPASLDCIILPRPTPHCIPNCWVSTPDGDRICLGPCCGRSVKDCWALACY